MNLSGYTKHGNFKLHSGQTSNVLYDVKLMICDNKLPDIINKLIEKVDHEFVSTFVGIETAGAIIATHAAYVLDTDLAIVTKDNELIGDIFGGYCLIDDVVTTENSIRKAIELIGYPPMNIFVVVDRRENKSLDIKSIFKV